MAGKVALIIIFNHRFDRNIEILENLYGSRFSHIYHLVPFYDGDKANVIPVYESSQYFQGYIAQGLKSYFNEKYEHYFFIGDDLILNPAINEDNYQQYFKLPANGSFIPEIQNLDDLANNDTLRFLPVLTATGKRKKWYWCKIKDLVKDYRHGAYAVENGKEMPTAEQAKAIIKKKGYNSNPLNYYDIHGGFFPLSSATGRFVYHLKSYFKKFNPAYPVVGSYSDIIIVSKSTIRQFCHYCGVFATNKLFVEFAIPTALLLAADKVITEPVLGKRGKIYWLYTKEEIEKFESDMKPYNRSLKSLVNHFPQNIMYIHPVKLSKWQTELHDSAPVMPAAANGCQQ